MSDRPASDPPARLTRWEQRTEVPLFAAGLLFLTGYAVRVLTPHDDEPWNDLALILVWSTWLLFLVDYGTRLRLSGLGARFVRVHWLDTLVLLLPCCARCAWSRCTRRCSNAATARGSACTRE